MKEPNEEIDRLAHEIIGAAIEAHRILGPGYLESVYEQALCIELEMRHISFRRQARLNVEYKGKEVGEGRMDVLVADKLVVELKTVDTMAPIHLAQALSYLKASGNSLALVINFNVPVLRDGIKRVVLT